MFNGRAVSLPDLVTEKRRNTTLSLSEGFAGARHEGSLAATAQNWCPRPGAGMSYVGQKEAGAELQRVLPMYYRTRQMALGTEKNNKRMPQKLSGDLRGLEKSLAREIRPLHQLFFQRFDESQLDRLLRAMPFLKLSQGRWLFGADSLGAQWPATNTDRSFILLQGHIALFQDPTGIGERTDIYRGAIFGEKRFMLGDESMRDHLAAAAHCEEPCIVGIITTAALEAAYSDRAFGNFRIAQSWRTVPSMSAICYSEARSMTQDLGNSAKSSPVRSPPQKQHKSDEEHGTVGHGLRDLSKVATALHVHTGEEIVCDEPLDWSVLVVSKGALEVRGDVTVTEKLEALPAKKVRMRVTVERAEQLAGESMFDKLDPYVIVKLGDKGKFQTPTLWNAGVNPKFDYKGVFAYDGEETMEVSVWDCDKFSADDPCGQGSIPVSDLYDGFKGPVKIFRQKRGILSANDTLDPEPAGKVYIRVTYDYEKVSALTKQPKSKSWSDMELFILGEQACWGHEHIMLQDMFMKTLEGATNQMPYMLQLSNIRVLGASQKGGDPRVSCWKVSKQRFMKFVKDTGREKPFLQACRVSTLDKQTQIRTLVKRLVKKWEIEMEVMDVRKGLIGNNRRIVDEAVDPSKFRLAYRGYKAHVTVRSANNLSGGGFFDKLDPYAIVRFRGSRETPFHTSILQDSGADPVWDCDSELRYNGETAVEISVWDFDKYSSHDLIGTGVVTIEQFCRGFEGMVQLSAPGTKKKKVMKPMMITIGISWPPLEQNPPPQNTWGTTTAAGGTTLPIAGKTFGEGTAFGLNGSFTGFGNAIA